MQEVKIEGVVVKELVSHPDQRGFFREIVRSSEPIFSQGTFAQWSHSKMTQDVVKAWHFHHRQTDWWYVASGKVKAVLYDNRAGSSTKGALMEFQLGDESDCETLCIRIPPGVLHGLRVESEKADLFYLTSETYDPEDEGRIPYDSDSVPFDWGEGAVVAERDTKPHTPPYELDS